MKPPAEEVEDDLAAEEENKLINEVRWQIQVNTKKAESQPFPGV